ncbi:hypothetical protein [Rhodococcus sp. AG1013]|uniref:hypothetical protein n=1 Tax=Rhodococcus sp. AG1013 TaxID=2183996 RepID=UPI0011C064C7|nr:hypothetical protein [Rhodococcus sp. AG1013]
MNSKHDPVNGRLFYDPRAEAEGESGANHTATEKLTSIATTASRPVSRSSEEIHRALFSAQ